MVSYMSRQNLSVIKRCRRDFQISIQIGRKKLVNGASANRGITKSPLTETGDSFKDGDNCGAELQWVVSSVCWVTVTNSLRLLWWRELPHSSSTLPPTHGVPPQTRRSAGSAESGCVRSYCSAHINACTVWDVKDNLMYFVRELQMR